MNHVHVHTIKNVYKRLSCGPPTRFAGLCTLRDVTAILDKMCLRYVYS